MTDNKFLKGLGIGALILIAFGAIVFIVVPVALAFFVVIYLFFFQPNQIKGQSMAPTYVNNEYIITNKAAVKDGPKRSDVIIYKSPKNEDIDFISRVVGMPGDTIKISSGKVYLNGALSNESAYLPTYVETGPEGFLDENEEYTVPQNSYFVMGDNRPHALDSREFGAINHDNIIGVVAFCYWNCSKT